MEEWQKRVFTESTDLDMRIKALELFITRNGEYNRLNDFEQRRLRDQHYHMSQYSKILHERMIHFEV